MVPFPEDGWIATIGTPLLEGSVMFFVMRLLFIKENNESQIEKLQLEVVELKRSAAAGLADGYYYNFIHSIASIL